MGGGESKQIQVQEIRKSSISKSPRLKNTKGSKSPEKPHKSPPQKKKTSQNTTSELFGNKTTESTIIENPKSHQQQQPQLTETRSKKKIKSVRKLPQGLEREQKQIKEPIQEVEELNNSSGKYDRKAKNEKHQMQKLIRIYDLG